MRYSPLIDVHRALGASIGEFAGVKTALDFGNPVEEHIATRTSATVFDLSHMGRIEVEGVASQEFLDKLVAKSLSKSRDGFMFGPTAFLNERGGFVDDVMLYRVSNVKWLVVCNAANVSKVLNWMEKWRKELGYTTNVSIRDRTEDLAMIAVQGPKSVEVMKRVGLEEVAELKPLQFLTGLKWRGSAIHIVSRSGWTGEDGFEILGEPTVLKSLFKELVDAGCKPAGLIARDSLRIEMGFCLYGSEIDEHTNPVEARYWVFDIDKPSYIGKEALDRVLSEGVDRVRLGVRMKKGVKFVPRAGYRVYVGNKEVGVVTSGTFSPVLGRAIAQAYISSRYAIPGLEVEIEIRGRRYRGKLVDFPFIKR